MLEIGEHVIGDLAYCNEEPGEELVVEQDLADSAECTKSRAKHKAIRRHNYCDEKA